MRKMMLLAVAGISLTANAMNEGKQKALQVYRAVIGMAIMEQNKGSLFSEPFDCCAIALFDACGELVKVLPYEGDLPKACEHPGSCKKTTFKDIPESVRSLCSKYAEVAKGAIVSNSIVFGQAPKLFQVSGDEWKGEGFSLKFKGKR